MLVMKLNSMKPAKISAIWVPPCVAGDAAAIEQAGRAADEAQICRRMLPNLLTSRTANEDADDQQHIDQGRALGREFVIVDEVGEIAHMRALVADRGGEDGRREDADAVGAEVLEKPRDRGEDRWRGCSPC